MTKRRMKIVIAVIFIGILGLAVRLMQIQLFQTEDFSKHHVNLLQESVRQRTQELMIDDGRGQFLDRHGHPLSYEEERVLVLFPFLRNHDWEPDKLAEILKVEKEEIIKAIDREDEPFVFGKNNPLALSEKEASEINQLEMPGVYAIVRKIAPPNRPAAQLLGITGENREEYQREYPGQAFVPGRKIGLTGMQKSFEELLQAEREEKLIYHVNGIGQPLFGMDVKYTGSGNPFYPLKVKTTIDKEIQEQMEMLLDRHGIRKGGAVLLDIETNELIAAVSRPVMDRDDPFSGEGAKNMLFEQHIPGSVFKTAVAAAAIDKGMVDEKETFDCSLDLYGKPAARELGPLNLEESFARSCNRTFAELASRLANEDPGALEEYSDRLGLTGELSWTGEVFRLDGFKQFQAAKGRIYTEEGAKRDERLAAQTGIGQQEVRLTPLGVANMMATIARGGEKMKVRTAREIQYGNETPLYTFDRQTEDRQLSKYTAIRLQRLLKSVVADEEGTGRYFSGLPYEVAGKSGTAETAVYNNAGQLHHKWFAGYFPFDRPKYALVTVNLEVAIDEGGVNPLFADIVKMLYDHESQGSDNLEMNGF